MKKIFSALFIILLLSACSNALDSSRTIVIAVALDYEEDAFQDKENNLVVNTLSNPPNDLSAFTSQVDILASGREMERHIFLSQGGARRVNGKREEWDKETILSTISSLEAEENDLVLFFYSGHGMDGTGELVVSAKEGKMDKISPDELLTALSEIGGKKCVFLDSCYSGAFVENAGMLADGEVFGEDGSLIKEGFLFSLGPALSLSITSGRLGTDDIWLMSATTDGQLSYDSGTEGLPNQEEYGAFSYFLISSLGYDMENDSPRISQERNEVTFLGLYRDIKRRMTESMWTEQTPQITLTPLDLVLF